MSIKCSVVIPTYNRRHVLERTLPALLVQDFPAEQWEIVVVVDGATDDTVDYLRSLKPPCKLTILEQLNQGQAAASNAGAKIAAGALIMLMDDDIICDTTLVRTHVAAHESRPECVVFGNVLYAPDSWPTLASELARSYAESNAARMQRQGGPQSPFEVWLFANCSMPRDLFVRIGGYDSSLTRAHDDELSIRIWKAGVPFHFEPRAVCHHFYAKSNTDFVTGDGPVDGRNELRLSRKHPEYRSRSPLSWLLKPGGAVRPFSWLSSNAPWLPELLLRPPCWAAERLLRIPAARSAGLFLLQRRFEIAMLRGATREAGSWRVLKHEFGMSLPVLFYHHIGARRPATNPRLTVSPQQFESQMRWLAGHGYVGIRPSDWVAWCREGKPLPAKPVLITLDDGYADVAEHALPLIRRLGFGAAVYVVTGRLGACSAWDEKWGFAAHPLMTAEQIRYWSERGIDFGAHSRTHPDLTALGRDRLSDEIEGSADDLARILGRRPTSFAYPYGIYDAKVHERVSRSFDLALTCDAGLNYLATGLHELRRAEVSPGGRLARFVWRLKRGGLPLTGLRQRLHLRSRGESAMRRLRAATGF